MRAVKSRSLWFASKPASYNRWSAWLLMMMRSRLHRVIVNVPKYEKTYSQRPPLAPSVFLDDEQQPKLFARYDLQLPTFMAAGEHRSPYKITVASLCCDAVKANSAFTASTEDHRFYGLKASSTSHAASTRAKRHQLECPGLSVTLPLPLSAHS
jgi:hypothetical protein